MNEARTNGKIVTIPEVATIEEIKDEIRGVKTFYLSLDDKGNGAILNTNQASSSC
jgi:hypothetical protein